MANTSVFAISTKMQCSFYSGKFESMDGPVEIKDEDIEKLASNHNTMLSKLSRLATGEHDPKNNPSRSAGSQHQRARHELAVFKRRSLVVGEYEKDGSVF